MRPEILRATLILAVAPIPCFAFFLEFSRLLGEGRALVLHGCEIDSRTQHFHLKQPPASNN